MKNLVWGPWNYVFEGVCLGDYVELNGVDDITGDHKKDVGFVTFVDGNTICLNGTPSDAEPDVGEGNLVLTRWRKATLPEQKGIYMKVDQDIELSNRGCDMFTNVYIQVTETETWKIR